MRTEHTMHCKAELRKAIRMKGNKILFEGWFYDIHYTLSVVVRRLATHNRTANINEFDVVRTENARCSLRLCMYAENEFIPWVQRAVRLISVKIRSRNILPKEFSTLDKWRKTKCWKTSNFEAVARQKQPLFTVIHVITRHTDHFGINTFVAHASSPGRLTHIKPISLSRNKNAYFMC